MNRTGTLRVVDGRPVLRFERRLSHPMEKVWQAITLPAQLAHWFPGRLEIESRVGGRVRWSFPEDGTVLPDGTVTAFDPPRLLEYVMPAENSPIPWVLGDETLRFELSRDPAGTLLVFTHIISDRAGAASFAAGWEGCLDALAADLDGKPAEPAGGYVDLHEEYVEAFGLLEGTAHETGDGWTVRFERQLPHPIDKVWAAVIAGAELAVGSPPPPRVTNAYVPAGAVSAVDPPRLLEYHWQAGDAPVGRMRWELSDGPGGARLVLTQTIPPELADQRVTALAAWHTHLELLAEELRGRTVCPWPEDRTEELRKHYRPE